MYSEVFCRVYNEFGWNYFPEAFAEELLEWLSEKGIRVKSSLDLACGSGVLCEKLHEQGIAAMGMDLSEGMIAVARGRNDAIPYEIADMITFRPAQRFDLVTCTGDALNHILDLRDVETIFRNVFGYLEAGGHFIFDILNEKEVPGSEPFDLNFSEDITAQFSVSRSAEGIINLKTVVFEKGVRQFEENITEVVHDIACVCGMLRSCGFELLRCADSLLDRGSHGSTCYIIARKPL